MKTKVLLLGVDPSGDISVPVVGTELRVVLGPNVRDFCARMESESADDEECIHAVVDMLRALRPLPQWDAFVTAFFNTVIGDESDKVLTGLYGLLKLLIANQFLTEEAAKRTHNAFRSHWQMVKTLVSALPSPSSGPSAPPDALVKIASGAELDNLVDRIGHYLSGMAPEFRRQVKLFMQVMSDYPDAGNHFLYQTFRSYGGKLTWKDFRNTLAIYRGDGPVPDDRAAEEAARNERRKQEREQERQRAEQARIAREKKREERQMTTIRREDLRRGQMVWIRVRYANQVKLRPARVLDVLRAAVHVQCEGEGEPRTVRFNEIELTPDGSDKRPGDLPPPAQPGPQPGAPLKQVPPAFQALGNGHGVQPVTPRMHPHPNVEVRRPLVTPKPPEAPPLPPPPSPTDQMKAWIEQGRLMRENLVKQKAVLQDELDALAAEALRVEEQLKIKNGEMEKLKATIAVIDQMGTAA